MRFGSPSASEQSAIEPANPRAVPVEYVRYALLGLAHHGRPRRVLMVGLGGGTFSTLVHRALPDATVDAVEIDPVVVAGRARALRPARGRRATGCTSPTPPTGWRAIGAAYDFVLLDAYAGEGIPAALATGSVLSGGRAAARARRRRRDQHRRDAGGGAGGRARLRRACWRRSTAGRRRSTATCCCSRPTARAPVDAAAMQRWLADWDARGVTDFSLAALAARPARGPACERWASGGAALTADAERYWIWWVSRPSPTPSCTADRPRRGARGSAACGPHGARVVQLVEQETVPRDVDPSTSSAFVLPAQAGFAPSGAPAARAAARRRPALARSRPACGTVALWQPAMPHWLFISVAASQTAGPPVPPSHRGRRPRQPRIEIAADSRRGRPNRQNQTRQQHEAR